MVSRNVRFEKKALNQETFTHQRAEKVVELSKLTYSDDKPPSDTSVTLGAEDADTDPDAEAKGTIGDPNAQGDSATNSDNEAAEWAIRKSSRTCRAP